MAIKRPFLEIDIEFEQGKKAAKKLNDALKTIQENSNGIEVKINDELLNKQLKSIENSMANFVRNVNASTDGISLNDAANDLNRLENSLENLTLARSTISKKLNSGIIDDTKQYKGAMEETLSITNKIDSKNNKILETTVKMDNNYDKLNQKKEKLLNTTQKELDALEKTKVIMNDKIGKLYANDVVPKELLQGLDSKVGNLDIGSSKTDIEKVNIEIKKLIDLQKELNNVKKNDRQGIINTFKKQEEIKIARELAELEKKNLNTSFTNMLTNRGSLIGKDNDLARRTLEVKKAIDNLNGSTTKDVTNEVKKLKAELSAIDSEAKKMGIMSGNKDRMSLTDMFKTSFSKLGVFFGATSALYMMKNYVNEAITHIINLDSEMVNLKKVSDETTESYDRFLEKTHESAIALGTQTTELVKATTAWKKTGETFDNASKLAENTMLLSKVGDIDVRQSQEYLVAPLKAFNIEAEQSIKLIDMMNNVSNNAAITTADLGEALKRSASSMALSGNSLEETITLITVAQEKTQLGGETVGNALKTVSMRLATMKDDETGLPIVKLADDLEKVGVRMTDASGQIRSTYDILKDLSVVFKDLDRNTQMSLLDKLFGKRQGNIGGAILQDLKDIERVMGLTQDSMGSAGKEFETYQQSIQYSLDQTRESVEYLFRSLIDNSFVKVIIGGFKLIIDGVSGIVNVFGGFGTAIAGVITYLVVFNKEFAKMIASQNIPFFTKLNQAIINYRNGLKASTLATKENTSAEQLSMFTKSASATTTNTLTLAQVRAAIATKVLTIGTYALQTALMFGLVGAITISISALVKFFDSLITTKEEIKEMNEAMYKNIQETSKQVKTSEDLFGKIQKTQQKLSETTDISERTKLMGELTDLERQLAEVLPESVSGFDAQGNLISDNNALIKETLDLKRQELELESLKFIEQNKNISLELEGYKKKKAEYEKYKLAHAKGEAVEYTSTEIVSGKSVDVTRRKTVTQEMLEDMQNDLKETTLLASKMQVVMQSFKSNGKTNKDLMDLGIDVEALEDFNNELKNSQTELDKTSDSMMSAEDKAKALKTTITELGDEFSKTTDQIGFIDKVLKELESGGISSSSFATMVEKYPELLSYLNNESTAVENLKNKRNELHIAQQKQYDDILANSEKVAQGEVDITTNKVNAQNDIEVKGANAKLDVNKSTVAPMIETSNALIKAFTENYQSDVDSFTNAQNAKQTIFGTFAKNISNAYSVLTNVMSNMMNKAVSIKLPNVKLNSVKLKDTEVGGKSGGSSKQEVADLDLKIDRYYILNGILDRINDEIARNEVLMKNASDQEKIEYLKQQNELYKKQKKAIEDIRKEQLKEKNEIENKLEEKGFRVNDEGVIINYASRLKAMQDYANSLKGEAKKKAQEQVKDVEALIKEYNNLVQKDIPSANKQILDINNKLIDTQKSIVDIIKKQRDEFIKAEEEKTKKVKDEIQKRKDAMNKEWKQEDFEDKLSVEQNKLNELQSLLSEAMRTNDIELINSLKRQIEEQQKVLNDAIRDNERDNSNQKYDDEMEKLDKDLQDKIDDISKKLSDEEILKLVQSGVYDLDNILKSIGSKTTDVTKTFLSVGEIIKNDWINSLVDFEKKLANISSKSLSDLTVSEITTSNRKESDNNKNTNVNITMPVRIENIDSNSINDVEKIFNKFKGNIVKEIAEALDR